MNAFSRSWLITKLSFEVIKKDKELLLFPLLAGIFSILFLIAIIFPTIAVDLINGVSPSELSQTVLLLLLFLLYFGLSFIATFFNVCVVFTTKKRFEGGNATFAESIHFAVSKIHLIFMWSIVSASVGILLRLLENLAERFGDMGKLVMRIVVSLLGMMWGIITLFVIPAMVYNNLGPFDAIKKSIATIKKTWGESLIRAYGLGLIQLVLIILGIVGGFFLVMVSTAAGTIGVLVALFAIAVYLIGVILIFSVANSVFNTALYVYAATGKIPDGFTDEVMKNAFIQKK